MRLFFLFLFSAAALNAATISLSGSPSSLIVSSATAGCEPDAVIDTTTTYSVSISSSQTGTISGYLLEELPSGTTLKVTLVAPTGGTSSGAVSLSQTTQPLVTNIPAGSYDDLLVTYRYSATVSAGVITPASFTLVLDVEES